MKWYDKLITIELAVLILLFGTFLVGASIGFPWSVEYLQTKAARLHNGGYAVIVCLAGLLLIGLAIRVLYVWLFRKEKKTGHLYIAETSLGKICMTEDALQTLLTKRAKQHREVASCRTVVKGSDQSVSVQLFITARADGSDTAWLKELQNDMEAYAMAYSGVAVAKVELTVEDADSKTALPRVQ